MKLNIKSIIVMGVAALCLNSTSIAASSFNTSGATSTNLSQPGLAQSNDQTIYKAMSASSQMQGVAGFWQAYMQVHASIRMMQSILGAATANSAVEKWDQTTGQTFNFTVTDPKGNSVGYNIVASASSSNAPADIASAYPLSLAISLGSTAAAAAATTNPPVLFVYFAQGAKGSKSNGVIIANNFNPAAITAGSGNAGAAPTAVPQFSGIYAWKSPNDGTNDNQAIGMFSVQPPSSQVGQPGMPTNGMTIFYKEDVNPTSGVAKIAITNSLPAAGSTPAAVASMTGSGVLALDSTTGLPAPSGNWTIGVQVVPTASQGPTNAPPAPPTSGATVINFASAGAAPTFVSATGTPPSINQGQVSVGQLTSPTASGSTCGQGGSQQCGAFQAASQSGVAPGLASNLVPPTPGSGGSQPTETLVAVFGAGAITLNPAPTVDLVTF